MAAESTPASPHATENLWHKVVAGVFGTVLAPVLVALGIRYSDRLATPVEKPAATVTAPAATGAPVASTPAAGAIPVAAPVATAPAMTPAAAPAVAAAPAATTPAATTPATNVSLSATAPAAPSGANPSAVGATAGTEGANSASGEVVLPHFKKPLSPVQRLFNGRDLTGFYTYIGHPHPKVKPYGKNHDPEKVFSVQNGMLRISGEQLGLIETEKEYTDYWLKVVYKWGEKTWGPEEDEARRSAILLNIDGPDGAIRGAFPASFHVQLIEGTTGDLLIASPQGEEHCSLTAAVEEKRLGKLNFECYVPGAPRSTFKQGIIKRYPATQAWRNTKGFHPANDLEFPTGEWNTLEIGVLNGKVLVQLNDHVCNFAIETSPAAGRIGIQSHGAELFVKEMTLQPYNKHHDSAEKSN